MPRRPARVFVRLLVSESGRMTAAELAEALQISPAAVSGAVRYLAQVDLVARERLPGTRREVYRIYHDAWYEVLTSRDAMLTRWMSSLDDGLAAVGADTPAGRRLAETRQFMEFLAVELAGIRQRWRDR